MKIESLLLQEMENVKGGSVGECHCTSGAGQSAISGGKCVCDSPTGGAGQKIGDTSTSCFCPNGGAAQQ